MIFGLLRFVAIVVTLVGLLVCAVMHFPTRWVFRILVRLFHMKEPIVHGSTDPSARVVVFNHPSHMEQMLLPLVFDNISGLVRDMTKRAPMLVPLHRALDCVMVPKEGGKNTTQRIIEKLAQHTRPIAIATSVLDTPNDVNFAGVIPGYPMPKKCPTIPYRLGQKVQPVVILYEGFDIVPCSVSKVFLYLFCQMKPVQPYVVLLPIVDPADFSSPEECMRHVRDEMSHALKTHWPHIISKQ